MSKTWRGMTDWDIVSLLTDMDFSVGQHPDGGCQLVAEIPEGNFNNCDTIFEVLEVLSRLRKRQEREAKRVKP